MSVMRRFKVQKVGDLCLVWQPGIGLYMDKHGLSTRFTERGSVTVHLNTPVVVLYVDKSISLSCSGPGIARSHRTGHILNISGQTVPVSTSY